MIKKILLIILILALSIANLLPYPKKNTLSASSNIAKILPNKLAQSTINDTITPDSGSSANTAIINGCGGEKDLNKALRFCLERAMWVDVQLDQCLGTNTGGGTLPASVPEPYNSLFTKAAAKYNMKPALLAAIFYAGEHASHWPDPNGPWASSSAGAKGPFQFIDGTWDSYGDDGDGDGKKDVQNLTDAAYGAANYLNRNGGGINDPDGDPDGPLPPTEKSVVNAIYRYNPARFYVKQVFGPYREFSSGSSATGGSSATTSNSSKKKVYMIGDSIAAGTTEELSSALKAKGFEPTIDGKSSRRLSDGSSDLDGINVLRADKDKWKDAGTIIIELGTNGTVNEGNISSAINLIKQEAPNAKIYWVNIGVDNSKRSSPIDDNALNNILKDNSSKGYNIIDWKTVESAHLDYIASDGIGAHPEGEGKKAFADTIVNALSGGTSEDCEEQTTSGGSVVEIAKKELGTKEEGGPDRGPRIMEYTDGNAEPWCADFVSWVYKQAGKPFTGGQSGGWRWPGALTLRSYFKENGVWVDNGGEDPQPGDVIVYNHQHTGIVERVDGNILYTIEGNYSDKVSEVTNKNYKSNSDISGFGRPKGGQ